MSEDSRSVSWTVSLFLIKGRKGFDKKQQLKNVYMLYTENENKSK